MKDKNIMSTMFQYRMWCFLLFGKNLVFQSLCDPHEKHAHSKYHILLIRYLRACSHYHDFLQRCEVLTEKLQKKGYVRPRLQRAFKKFYGRHHELVKRYNVSVCQITKDIFSSMSMGDVYTF